MSDKNEQEKLTLGSRKGYDGSTARMPDEHQEEPSNDPERPEEGRNPDDESGEPTSEADRKKMSAFLEVITKIFAGNDKDAKITAAETFTKVTQANEAPETTFAKVLSLYIPEKKTEEMSDTQVEEAAETKEIFDVLLDSAEEAGLDTAQILRELGEIKKEDPASLPQTHEDRFQAFEALAKELPRKPEKEELQKVHKKWESLRKAIAKNKRVDETDFENVLEAETLLAELVDERLITTYDEMDDATRAAYDHAFAKLSFTIATAIMKDPLPPQPIQEGEEIDPQEEVKLVSGILFVPGESKKSKETKLAAFLQCHPIEGLASERLATASMREQVFDYAKDTGLDINRILIKASKKAAEPQVEQVSELEQISELNEFEKLIEEDIIDAKSDKVEKIQNAWKQLLEHEGLDNDLQEQAREAIGVLQNIIDLKKKKEEHESGQQVVNRHLEDPRVQKDRKEEEDDADEGAEGKEQLATTLSEFLKFLSPNFVLTSEDMALIDTLVGTIANANRHTQSDIDAFMAEKRVAALLFLFSMQTKDATLVKKLRRQIFNYVDENDLKGEEVRNELKLLEDAKPDTPDPQEQVEQLLLESLKKATGRDTDKLRAALENVLQKSTEDSPSYKAAKDALGMLPSEQAAEQAGQETEDLVETIKLKKQLQPVKDESMREYLFELMQKVNQGNMNTDELSAALNELNAQDALLVSRLQAYMDASDTQSRKKERTIDAYQTERTVNAFRKLLIERLNNEQPKEETQTVSDAKLRRVERLIIDTENANQPDAADTFTRAKLTKYINDLEKVIEIPDSLTKEQLEATYLALQTQDAILRGNADHEGKASEYIELFQRVLQIQAVVQGQLAQTQGDNLQSIEVRTKEKVREKAKVNAHTHGDIFFGQTVDYSPIRVEPSPYTHGGMIGDSIQKVRNLSVQPISPTLTPEIQQILPEIEKDVKIQDIYSNEPMIAQLETQLSQLITQGFREGKTFADMKQAREIAKLLAQQKEALSALPGYKSTKEEKKYAPEDEILFEGYIHTALGERMQRIKIELEIQADPTKATYIDSDGIQKAYKRRNSAEILSYYKELKRWAKVLIENDSRANPSKAGPDALRLPPERYRQLKELATLDMDSIDVHRDRQAILDKINYLQDRSDTGGNFLRYFLRNTPDPNGPRRKIDPATGEEGEPYESDINHLDKDPYNPENLLGAEYIHAEGTTSFGVPKSLEDSMEIIAKQYTTDKSNYKTGGNRELIDAEGNFKYNNFYYWIREQINADINYNKDGPINPFQKINLKGEASSVSLAELLILVPEYLSKRTFEINMNAKGEIDAAWGQQREHPDFTWAQANQLGAEVEFRQLIHEVRIQYIRAGVTGDKEEFLKLMQALHNSNHWSRGGEDGPNILWLLGLPSSVTNGTQEIDDCYGNGKEKQGSVGKSISDMLAGYYYLSEVTDFYETGEHGHKREKTFNENMFYKFWEPNGANTFLVTMAEGALNHNNQAKRRYAEFVKARIEDAANRYRSQGLTADQAEKLNQMKNKQDEELSALASLDNASVGIDISFTTSSHLTNFLTFMENNVVTGRRPESAERIGLRVRDDLLDHLKADFFKPLLTMQVAETGKADATGLYLKKDGTIAFGDIKVGGGQTMTDLLMDFDPDQIKQFDYKNNHGDSNDPIEVKRRALGRRDLTEAEMREALDEYMEDPRNVALFKRNEKMMLAFTQHVARVERKWINHFRDIPENESARIMVMNAFKKCVEKAHGIDDMESEYAWTQARDYVYIWGIGGTLDVTGIGFRMDGKLNNFGLWRAHRGGKDGFGNEETIEEFHALSLPFLHALRIIDIEGTNTLGHQSVWSLIQGGHGSYIMPRAIREFKARSKYRMAHDAEELYVTNNLTNAANLVDLISTTEFDFSQIISTDALGNVTFEYGKARKLFKDWRKAIRYALQKNGLDYREVIWANGGETSLYNHFFGKRTRAINELKKRDLTKLGVYKTDEEWKEPADAMMLSIIAAEVYEHRKTFSNAHHWNIQNVIELERTIRQFMQEFDLEEEGHGDRELILKRNAFTRNIFKGALRAYRTAYFKMYAAELNSSFWGGLFNGLWAGVKEYLTKGKWIY